MAAKHARDRWSAVRWRCERTKYRGRPNSRRSEPSVCRAAIGPANFAPWFTSVIFRRRNGKLQARAMPGTSRRPSSECLRDRLWRLCVPDNVRTCANPGPKLFCRYRIPARAASPLRLLALRPAFPWGGIRSADRTAFQACSPCPGVLLLQR
jgi:hypothetical protein